MDLLILDPPDIKGKFIDSIEKFQNKIILYLHPTEFVGDPFNRDEANKDEIVEISKVLIENNSQLYVVYGGNVCYRYEILKNLNVDKIVFLFWPTFLLHYTHYMLLKSYGNIPKYNPHNFKKLFINFNQKPKQHRAMFVDLIHQHNLIESCLFSWNEKLNEWSNNYTFKFWDEKITRLDLYKDRQELDVRKDYFTDFMLNNSCLFNIHGESMDNNDIMFITEKTYKSLLTGQPFISIGSPYQNKVLETFGFKLYNNLIDYSFDQESNIFDRVGGLIKNLKRLKDEDLNELYNQIKSIAYWNSVVAQEIIKKDNYIPTELLNLYNEYKNKFKEYSERPSYMDVGEYLFKIFEEK